MNRIALLLLVMTCAASAQLSNTVTQLLLSDVTSPTASSPIRNIGQSNHKAYITFASQPGQICTVPAGNRDIAMGFDASYDGANWFAIGLRDTTIDGNSKTSAVEAQGAFPFIRFNIYDFTASLATVCIIHSVEYTGSLYPDNNSVVESRDARFLPHSFLLTGITTANWGSILPWGSAYGFDGLFIYGLEISTNVAGTYTLSNCLGTGPLDPLIQWATSGPDKFTIPTSEIPSMELSPGTGLCVTSSATATVSGYVVYRYERPATNSQVP